MSLNDEIERLLRSHSRDEIIDALRQEDCGEVLSIISDGGMHRRPSDLIIGREYIFSRGMIDTSDDLTVRRHILDCCKALAAVLREREWQEVRLFFSGHALLGAYAKLTVYRVTHLDTIDFGFFGDAGFRRLELSLRPQLIT